MKIVVQEAAAVSAVTPLADVGVDVDVDVDVDIVVEVKTTSNGFVPFLASLTTFGCLYYNMILFFFLFRFCLVHLVCFLACLLLADLPFISRFILYSPFCSL